VRVADVVPSRALSPTEGGGAYSSSTLLAVCCCCCCCCCCREAAFMLLKRLFCLCVLACAAGRRRARPLALGDLGGGGDGVSNPDEQRTRDADVSHGPAASSQSSKKNGSRVLTGAGKAMKRAAKQTKTARRKAAVAAATDLAAPFVLLATPTLLTKAGRNVYDALQCAFEVAWTGNYDAD